MLLLPVLLAFLVADYDFGSSDGRFRVQEVVLTSDGLVIETPPGEGLGQLTLALALAVARFGEVEAGP